MYMLERIHDEYGQLGLQPKLKGKLTYLIQAHTSSPSLSSGTLITLSIKENLALDEQNLSEHSRVRPPWGALDWLRPNLDSNLKQESSRIIKFFHHSTQIWEQG